jgi:hypothetical protein
VNERLFVRRRGGEGGGFVFFILFVLRCRRNVLFLSNFGECIERGEEDPALPSDELLPVRDRIFGERGGGTFGALFGGGGTFGALLDFNLSSRKGRGTLFASFVLTGYGCMLDDELVSCMPDELVTERLGNSNSEGASEKRPFILRYTPVLLHLSE